MAGLSVARVKAESRVGLHGDVTRGLYLQVARNGTKSWIYRYQVGGKRRLMGLGPVDVVTLAAARDAAHASRRAVLEGRDPIDERRAARDAVALERVKTRTVSEVLDLYLRAHQEGWKGGRTAAQWRASLTRYALPKIGKLPVSLVDVGAVMAVIEELWREKPETASRVRRRVEALLDFAAARGWRTGDNPARWSGHIETLLPARTAVAPVEHFAALPIAELSGFMAELAHDRSTASRAFRFLVLTCARRDEVLGMTWSEINLPNRVWTVPANRMKGKREQSREHRVPLSDAAVALLGDPGDPAAPVFPSSRDSRRPMYKDAFAEQLKAMGRAVTVHGFRSTFRDWAAERGVDHTLAELALAHHVGTAVERSYRRTDLFAKRRQLMEAWMRFAMPSDVTGAGEVVPIRR